MNKYTGHRKMTRRAVHMMTAQGNIAGEEVPT